MREEGERFRERCKVFYYTIPPLVSILAKLRIDISPGSAE